MARPEISIPAALATGTLVVSLYQRQLPPGADLRAAPAGDETVEAARKQNAWMAAGIVSAISLIARDATIFIVGGTLVVGLDWLSRANIWTNPVTGTFDPSVALRAASPRAESNVAQMSGRTMAPSEGVVA